MDGKEELKRHWKRLQAFMLCFTVGVVLAAVVYPPSLFPIWVVGLPIAAFLMWRLRCWNCNRRLLANGGTEIEWTKAGLAGWRPCRHKTCGATLL
jgi:Flp pilus assembly protein TadB